MHYFSNIFSKIAKKRWGLSVDGLKLGNLAKLWFFILIITVLARKGMETRNMTK